MAPKLKINPRDIALREIGKKLPRSIQRQDTMMRMRNQLVGVGKHLMALKADQSSATGGFEYSDLLTRLDQLHKEHLRTRAAPRPKTKRAQLIKKPEETSHAGPSTSRANPPPATKREASPPWRTSKNKK